MGEHVHVGACMWKSFGIFAAATSAVGTADVVSDCQAAIKTAPVSETYRDYCGTACTTWGSNYGAAFCGVEVTSDLSVLLSCLEKMEVACAGASKGGDTGTTPGPTTSSATTTPPTTSKATTQTTSKATTQTTSKATTQTTSKATTQTTSKATTQTTSKATTQTTSSTSATTAPPVPGPTDACEVATTCAYDVGATTCPYACDSGNSFTTTTTKATTGTTKATTGTTKATTGTTKATTATTKATTATTKATTATTKATTKATTATTASSGDGSASGFAIEFPSDAAATPISGPTGPSGECVWSYSGGEYSAGSYAGVGNKVYKASQWAGTSDVPGQSAVWQAAGECTGTAPAVLTLADMTAQADANVPRTFFDAWTPRLPSRQETEAVEAKLESDANIKALRDAARVLPRTQIEAITPGSGSNPENVKRVETFVTPETWDQMFPFRHQAYSYENYLKAVGAFPDYCKTYDDGRDSDTICKKLVAASFAHYAQETGANAPAWTIDQNELNDGVHKNPGAAAYFKPGEAVPTYLQGLYWVREAAFQNGGGDPESVTESTYEACDPQSNQPWSIFFPCSDAVTYYGRGSKQLSWNYNYGLFSRAMFNDVSTLLNEPRQVADTWLNFASGIWFAVTPQPPKPPMTWALDGTWTGSDVDRAAGLAPGFGATIEIINGGYECRGESAQAANRIKAYQAFSKLFGLTIPAGEPNECSGSTGFPSNSPAAVQFYWNKDWSNFGSCKQGNEQSPFTVVTPGDYARCVDFYYRSHTIYQGKEILTNGDTVW
ncbi:chitinase [Gregarina niphandrodes]|uniref:Chitinase n=1 Tax=Gregarina niphandrodes TaxID=110365 RepID=A0A023B5F7_GRENI|nr:chitinase [Gregarina niphandrodes]EZG60232.1 chitinase [Gregarina niphandrodes]|eukprot:XP_011130835.1 chitinase [Gregarina niphandrodes]